MVCRELPQKEIAVAIEISDSAPDIPKGYTPALERQDEGELA